MNGGVGGFVGEEDWVGYVRGMRQLSECEFSTIGWQSARSLTIEWQTAERKDCTERKLTWGRDFWEPCRDSSGCYGL